MDYKCFCCGRENVKLWRPYGDDSPLICASCAEERQSNMEYEEVIWLKDNHGFLGKPTGKKVMLPKWVVNDEGKVPSYYGPGPDGTPVSMTDELVVNLKDVDERYSSGQTTLLPAVVNNIGCFYSYSFIPESKFDMWKKLPNK